MTYDQRVQQIVYDIGIMEPLAKRVVAAQAKAIKEYVIKESAIPADFTMTAEDYLIQNGYVPSPEVTTTPNVEQSSNSMAASPDKQIWVSIPHEQWFVYPVGTKIKGATGAVQVKTEKGWVWGVSDIRNKPFRDEPYLINTPLSECEHVNSSWSSVFMIRVCDDCGHKLPEDPGGQYAMGPGH
jgi:hypothetical protein